MVLPIFWLVAQERLDVGATTGMIADALSFR